MREKKKKIIKIIPRPFHVCISVSGIVVKRNDEGEERAFACTAVYPAVHIRSTATHRTI